MVKIESEFDYNGYPCLVLFLSSGYRCGYVGLPKASKFYKTDFDRIPVSCHGCLTYGQRTNKGNRNIRAYWIGFDCCHLFDKNDYESAKKYFDSKTIQPLLIVENIEKQFNTDSIVRTQEYCEQECRNIVDQIIELEKGGSNG